jgi:hypothetical protein
MMKVLVIDADQLIYHVQPIGPTMIFWELNDVAKELHISHLN